MPLRLGQIELALTVWPSSAIKLTLSCTSKSGECTNKVNLSIKKLVSSNKRSNSLYTVDDSSETDTIPSCCMVVSSVHAWQRLQYNLKVFITSADWTCPGRPVNWVAVEIMSSSTRRGCSNCLEARICEKMKNCSLTVSIVSIKKKTKGLNTLHIFRMADHTPLIIYLRFPTSKLWQKKKTMKDKRNGRGYGGSTTDCLQNSRPPCGRCATRLWKTKQQVLRGATAVNDQKIWFTRNYKVTGGS